MKVELHPVPGGGPDKGIETFDPGEKVFRFYDQLRDVIRRLVFLDEIMARVPLVGRFGYFYLITGSKGFSDPGFLSKVAP
jgi:hypothetical protein